MEYVSNVRIVVSKVLATKETKRVLRKECKLVILESRSERVENIELVSRMIETLLKAGVPYIKAIREKDSPYYTVLWGIPNE